MPWRVVAGTPCARALEHVRADPLTPYPHWQRAPLSGRSGDRHTPRPSCRARPRGAHRAQSAPCPGGWCDRDPWTAPSSPGIFPRQARGPTRRLVGADVSSPHAAPRARAGSAAVGGARPLLSPSAPGGLRGEQGQVSQGREQRSETRPPTPLSRVLAHLAAPVQEACEPGRCGWRVPAVAAASARRAAGAVVSPCAPSPLPPTNACLRSVRSLRQDRGLSAGAAGPRFPGHTPGRSRNGPLPWGSAGAGRRATARGDGASRAFRAVHTGD